ncbi:early nodulin-11-like [Penaeus monodon]|uniref:early nodulin-11-like n=1 Tax=Penaeus monodon TaxID=6687 RepID=UPI0018A6FC1B|nr:early nodulin-11-like [Penaeus monodon]
MSLKVILAACVAVVALADKAPVHHLPPVYAAPTYHAPEPVYHAPAHYNEPEYPTVPPKYNYNYGVADGYSGANFGHLESPMLTRPKAPTPSTAPTAASRSSSTGQRRRLVAESSTSRGRRPPVTRPSTRPPTSPLPTTLPLSTPCTKAVHSESDIC